MADCPIVGGLGLALEQTALVEAVFEGIESDLHMPRRIHCRRTARFLFLIIAELRVQEFEMHGIGRVVHALYPIARQRIDLDRAIKIIAHQQVPARQERHRRRTHIGPDEAAERLARIGLDLDLLFVAQLGMREILERHLDAIALQVERPAVIGAAQAAILGNAVFERHAAMRASVVDEAVFPLLGAEQGQVFAEEAHLLHGLFGQLALGTDHLPIATQQMAHRRVRADLGQTLVLCLCRHALPPYKDYFIPLRIGVKGPRSCRGCGNSASCGAYRSAARSDR